MRGTSRVVGAEGDTARHGTTPAKWQGVACASCSPGPRDVRPRRGTGVRRGSAGDVIPATRRLPPAACRGGPPGPRLFRPVTLYLTPTGAGVGLVLAAAIMRAVCGAIPQRFGRHRCAAARSFLPASAARRDQAPAHQQGLFGPASQPSVF